MRFFIKILFFYSIITLFCRYLFLNIENIGDLSPGLPVLLCILIIGILLLLTNIKRFKLKKSIVLILIYFLYVLFTIIFNSFDLVLLKTFTIGTSGGIVIFYVIGLIFSLVIHKIALISNSNSKIKFSNFIFGMYLVMHSVFMIHCFLSLSENLRTDIFILSNLDGHYQRPGAFLSIDIILLSFLYVNNYLLQKTSSLIYKIIYFILLILNLVFAMIFSQMLGSNNGLVNIFCALFLILTFHFILISKNQRLVNKKLKIKDFILGDLSMKLFSSSILSLSCITIVLLSLITILNIDTSVFRISGFSSNEVTSVSTRLDLLDNFLIHFSHAPILGDIKVDEKTTGKGTYIHSFILSMLTHLGLIGSFIFVLFLIFSINELFKENYLSVYFNYFFRVFKILMFVCVLSVAIIGVFFSNSTVWFIVGLTFNPLIVGKNRSYSYE